MNHILKTAISCNVVIAFFFLVINVSHIGIDKKAIGSVKTEFRTQILWQNTNSNCMTEYKLKLYDRIVHNLNNLQSRLFVSTLSLINVDLFRHQLWKFILLFSGGGESGAKYMQRSSVHKNATLFGTGRFEFQRKFRTPNTNSILKVHQLVLKNLVSKKFSLKKI